MDTLMNTFKSLVNSVLSKRTSLGCVVVVLIIAFCSSAFAETSRRRNNSITTLGLVSSGGHNRQNNRLVQVGELSVSEGIRPHGEYRPAAWLPVQFYDKAFEDWFVIMPGKILAMDNDGRIVPGQYGLA